MTEELTLAEHVQHLAAIHELDGPAPHNPHVLQRLLPLTEDRHAGGEELHLHRPRELLQGVFRQIVEGCVPAQELDYVVHGCWSRPGVRSTEFSLASLLGCDAAIIRTQG